MAVVYAVVRVEGKTREAAIDYLGVLQQVNGFFYIEAGEELEVRIWKKRRKKDGVQVYNKDGDFIRKET